MKKSIISSLILCIVLTSLTSCSSWMKCTVQGEPGTQILNTYGDLLATIPQSGATEIKLKRKDRKKDFLLTRQTPESPIIPMGLNYDKRNMAGREAACYWSSVVALPLFWIPILVYGNYTDNYDVSDELKLSNTQSANSDLNNLVMNASLPTDEIKAYSPREYKGASTSSSVKHAKDNSKKEEKQKFGSPEDYYEYTKEFLTTPDQYSIEEFVLLDVALASKFKNGVYKYTPGESTFTIDKNTLYEDDEVKAKFNPLLKNVIVITSSGEAKMPMILYTDKNGIDHGLRAIKYKKDGKIVLYDYVRNNSGKYVNNSYYTLYR